MVNPRDIDPEIIQDAIAEWAYEHDSIPDNPINLTLSARDAPSIGLPEGCEIELRVFWTYMEQLDHQMYLDHPLCPRDVYESPDNLDVSCEIVRESFPPAEDSRQRRITEFFCPAS